MGKIPFIITGASGSIGAEATRGLLLNNKSVIMAVRNVEKALPIKQQIEQEITGADIEIRKLDLADLSSVQNFVQELKNEGISPAGLLNNAATLNRDFAITTDGFEATVQTNYLAVYLLTRLLMPIMQPKASIVNTVSVTRKIAKMDKNFFCKTEKDFSQLGTYSTTKFALLMFTSELIKRYGTEFYVNASDPGIVNSNMISMHRWFDPLADIFFRPFIKTPRQGAMPAVNACLASSSGDLYRKNNHKPLQKLFAGHELSTWLWTETEKILEAKSIKFDK